MAEAVIVGLVGVALVVVGVLVAVASVVAPPTVMRGPACPRCGGQDRLVDRFMDRTWERHRCRGAFAQAGLSVVPPRKRGEA